jgi:hypothetical protein
VPRIADAAQHAAVRELVDRIDKLCVRWGEVY